MTLAEILKTMQEHGATRVELHPDGTMKCIEMPIHAPPAMVMETMKQETLAERKERERKEFEELAMWSAS